MLHTARGLALEPGTLLHVGAVPYKGSAPALRLLHTARGLALEPGTLLHVGAVPYKGSAPALRLPPWWRILLVLKIASGFCRWPPIVGITTAVWHLLPTRQKILDCQAPHPFPERWTMTWDRSRQDHPTSRGQIPFAARVV